MTFWNYGIADKLDEMIYPDDLKELIDNEYISEVKHPDHNLWIYCYTRKCFTEGYWNKATSFCRGLVVDKNNRILSRPIPKFFDLQHIPDDEPTFSEVPVVSPKMDGSLGVMYPCNRSFAIASKSRFDSDHAKVGTELLHELLEETGWQPRLDYTYLFEIIDPRIPNIVDYGKEKGLYLITSIHTRSGIEIRDFGDDTNYPGPRIETVDFSIEHGTVKASLEKLIEDNPSPKEKEGYVAYFPTTRRRVKVKTENYQRASSLFTHLSLKKLYNFSKSFEEFEKWYDRIDEYLLNSHMRNILKDERGQLEFAQREIKETLRTLWNAASSSKTRKEAVFALQRITDFKPYFNAVIQNFRYPGEPCTEEFLEEASWRLLQYHPIIKQSEIIKGDIRAVDKQ